MKPEDIARICAKHGVKEFPVTDRRYSEPPSVILLSRPPAPSSVSDVVSTPADSEHDAGSTNLVERYDDLLKQFVARFGQAPSGESLFSLRLTGVIEAMKESLNAGVIDPRLNGADHDLVAAPTTSSTPKGSR